MKKLLCVLMSALILAVMPVTAYAKSSRAVIATLSLDFEDSIAHCAASVSGDHLDDHIRAAISLYYGEERITIWHDYADAVLSSEKDVDISEYGAGTYYLTILFTINNVAYERATMSAEYDGN